MKRGKLLYCAFFLLYGSESPAGNPLLTLTSPSVQKTYTLTELRSKLESVTVTIHDPVYHQDKTYDGFELEAVFKLLDPLPADSDEWVFTALDGYAPGISVSKAKQFHPVLTYREHGKEGFTAVPQGKSMLDPGPFYVIWKEKVGEEVPWPYQLASIELVSFAKKFPKLYPVGGFASRGSALRGFTSFKNFCIRCHSVNLEGGELAPELNIPKNITEYWQEGVLKQFIRNAPGFRAKSKMPSFEKTLSTKQVEEIIDYLKLMKNSKMNVGTLEKNES